MDPSDQREPIGESLSYSSQRAAQMISLAAAAAEVAARRRALHNARKAAGDEQSLRDLQARQRALHAEAKSRWAPAHDSRWLASADLLQTGRVWGAAVAYADADPLAASALRKTEERLRVLHPYAMSRYDRLREEGASALDAMAEAASLFARAPHARSAQPTRRPSIDAATARPDNTLVDTAWVQRVSGARPRARMRRTAAEASSGPASAAADPFAQAEQRGRQIAERLQARARRERGSDLPPEELATVLEETTTLPGEVIERIARARYEEQVAAVAAQDRAAHLGRAANTRSGEERGQNLRIARRDAQVSDTAGAQAADDRAAARLAAESFPYSATDGIRAALQGRLAQSERMPTHTPSAADNRRLTQSV